MSRSRTILVAVVSVLFAPVSLAAAERRIEGTVLGAKATYCAPRSAEGCAGELKLAIPGTSRPVFINVPVGTPISAGCRPLAFGALQGRRVVVTEVEASRGATARAISAADAPPERGC